MTDGKKTLDRTARLSSSVTVLRFVGTIMVFVDRDWCGGKANGLLSFWRENRMYEVLGLFVPFVVRIMLPTDVVQIRHQKKLVALRRPARAHKS